MIRPLLIAAALGALAAPAVAQESSGVTAPPQARCGTGQSFTLNGRRLDNGPAVITPRGSGQLLPVPAPKCGLSGTIDLLFRPTDPQPILDKEPARPEPPIMANEPNVRPENRGGFQLIEKVSATDSTPTAGGKSSAERDAKFMRNRAKGIDDRLPLEVVGRDELLDAGSPSIEEIARSLNEVGHVGGDDAGTIDLRRLGKGQVIPIPLNRTAPPAPVKVEETGK